MTTTITVSTEKGGAAKTTTAVNLACALGERGYSVLVVDLDPQGNASRAFGCPPGEPDAPSSADLLQANGRTLVELVTSDVAPGVDLVPANNVALKMAERELQQAIGGPRRLAQALKPTDGVYSFVIADTPPSVDGVVVPALVAADYVLSPTPRSEWAVTGAARVMAAVAEIRAAEMGNPEYLGIVWTLTMDRSSQNFVRDQVLEQGLPVFGSEIPHRQAAQDAELLGQPALISDPRGDLAEAYRDLAGELLIRMGASISTPADGGGVGTNWQERKKAKKDRSKKLKSTKGKGKKKGAA